MTVKEAKKERSKRLAVIILAALIGIALVVFGGHIAQNRNMEQYAERHVQATVDQYHENLENNFDGDTAALNVALTSAFNTTPISGSEMLIVSNGRENMLNKVGSATPSVEQTQVISNTDYLNEIHAPGSGRITTNDGDFTYVTRLLDVGEASALVTAAYHMGPLDESADQTRTAMIFLGLGALILIAIAVSHALPSAEDMTGVDSEGNVRGAAVADDEGRPAPARTQVMPTATRADEAETRASTSVPRQTVAVPAGGRFTESTTSQPTEEFSNDDHTGSHTVSPADVPTAPTPEESDEIRASDVRQ